MVVDLESAVVVRDGLGESPVQRVVFQEIGQAGGIGNVSDCHHLEVGVVDQKSEYVPTDAAKAHETNACLHPDPLRFERLRIGAVVAGSDRAKGFYWLPRGDTLPGRSAERLTDVARTGRRLVPPGARSRASSWPVCAGRRLCRALGSRPRRRIREPGPCRWVRSRDLRRQRRRDAVGDNRPREWSEVVGVVPIRDPRGDRSARGRRREGGEVRAGSWGGRAALVGSGEW